VGGVGAGAGGVSDGAGGVAVFGGTTSAVVLVDGSLKLNPVEAADASFTSVLGKVVSLLGGGGVALGVSVDDGAMVAVEGFTSLTSGLGLSSALAVAALVLSGSCDLSKAMPGTDISSGLLLFSLSFNTSPVSGRYGSEELFW